MFGVPSEHLVRNEGSGGGHTPRGEDTCAVRDWRKSHPGW